MQDNIEIPNGLNGSEGEDANVADYMDRADAAMRNGDYPLSLQLYLTAYEKDASGREAPSELGVKSLKQAWVLAFQTKERSLAEYIFERLMPHLTEYEAALCGEQLQKLMFDKLLDFGISRDDLESMGQAIAQDIAAGQNVAPGKPTIVSATVVTPRGRDDLAKAIRAKVEQACQQPQAAGLAVPVECLTYADLPGYREAISIMREFGIGMRNDLEFKRLVDLLNVKHGLDRMPVVDSLLFRSSAREDAQRFMLATLGELGLPAVRMRMEDNLQGMPMLCVMTQGDINHLLNPARNEFVTGGVLILEDIDLWGSPVAEPCEDVNPAMVAQATRGAREACNLIRSAVDNPDVYVLASASKDAEIDPFFLELLEPVSVVDIELPTPEERAEIWTDIAKAHPSMRNADLQDLVRYSANMPRFDIYMAAREALEDSYKRGLLNRSFVPVTADNLFEKLSAYQPLESEEYRALENAVIDVFQADLAHIDDLLLGQ